MRAPARWGAGLIAGGAATGILMATVPVWTRPPAPPLPPGGDRIQEIAQTVRTKHFYAAPEVSDLITPAQVAKIQDAATHSRVPLFIAYTDHQADDDGFYIEADGLDQLENTVGIDGYYVLVDRDGSAWSEGRGYADPGADPLENAARPAAGLLEMVHELASQDPEPPYASGSAEYFPFRDGVWTGLLVGVVGAALAMLVLTYLRRWMRLGLRPATVSMTKPTTKGTTKAKEKR